MVTFGVNRTPETNSFQEEIRILVCGFRDFSVYLSVLAPLGLG